MVCKPHPSKKSSLKYYISQEGPAPGLYQTHQEAAGKNPGCIILSVESRDEGVQLLLVHPVRTRHEVPLLSVKRVQMKLQSQKNHQKGACRILDLVRTEQPDSALNHLINSIIMFSKYSRVTSVDPFLCRWKTERKVLQPSMVSSMLKSVARTLGYSEKSFSTHSNRTGSATKLYEAGYSIDDISLAIGWTSDAVFGYIRDRQPSTLALSEKLESSKCNHRRVLRTQNSSPYGELGDKVEEFDLAHTLYSKRDV